MIKQKTRKKTQIADRRQEVSELYLRGWSMNDIAEKLKIDRTTVSRDLSELRKEWLERSINHVAQKKAIELAKIDQLEATYWDAWDASKLGKKGNPAYLTGVQWCISERCKIIGINAPMKIAPTDPSGDNPYMLASADSLRKLAEEIANAGLASD